MRESGPFTARSALDRLGEGTTSGGSCAVDDVLRTGDRRGAVGAREQHGVGDLIGRDIAAKSG